jgi:hypothetical protein
VPASGGSRSLGVAVTGRMRGARGGSGEADGDPAAEPAGSVPAAGHKTLTEDQVAAGSVLGDLATVVPIPTAGTSEPATSSGRTRRMVAPPL